MSNIKEAFQRFLSIALSVTTTVWLSGITLLLPVSPVAAATPAQYGLKEGDLVRAPSLPAPAGWAVYIINNAGFKRHIFNPDVFNMYGHLKWSNIKDVAGDTVNAFTTSDLYRIDGDPRVWSVDSNGVKHWVNVTAAEFVQKSYSWDQIFLVNPTEGNYYTMGSDITSGVTPPTGGLTLSVSPNTAASGVLAAGTVFNKILTLRLSAGSQAASVTSLTVTKDGFIQNSWITGISVWQGTMRKGNILTSLTSDGKATFTFGTPISVAAGSTVDLDVAVNISSSATSGTLAMKVNSAADILAGGSVSGNFPVMGNGFSAISSGQLGAYTITAQSPGGSTSFPADGSGNLDMGGGKDLGKFQLSETTGREDLMVKQVVVYVEGSLQADDVSNWTLIDSAGSSLGTGVVAMPYITFDLSAAYRVPAGTNRTLTVRGTPVNGANRTMRLHIQNDYDVIVSGFQTGTNIAASSFSDQAASDGYWRLKQGALTISKSSDSPSGNITPGSTDIVLAKFDIKATGEDLEIRKMDVEVLEALSSTTAQNLGGNLKVQSDDGALTYLSIAADTASLQIYGATADNSTRFDLNNYLYLKSGETKKIKVVGTTKTTVTSAQTYQVRIGNFYGWRVSTKDFKDNMPSATASSNQANTLTVQTSSLSVSRDASLANQNRAKGSNGQVVGQFVVNAGSSEDVTVSSVSLLFDTNASYTTTAAANSSTDDASVDVSNVSVWFDGVQFGSTVGTPSTGTTAVSFNGTLAIPKSGTKVLTVKANVKSSPANADFRAVVSAIAATGVTTSNTLTVTNSNDDGDADTTAGQAISSDPAVGQLFTWASGSLTISKDASASIAKILTAGTTGVELSKVRLQALNDTLTLSKIRFKMSAAGKGKYIKMLSLWDGSTKLGEKALSADEALFDGLSLQVAPGTDKILTVKADLADYSQITAGTDVSTFAVQIKSDGSDDMQVTGNNGTLAVGDINGAGSNADIAQSSFFLFHAVVPVIVKGTVSSTTLGIATNQEAYKFTVQASNANAPVRLGKINVKFTTSGLSATGKVQTFELWKDGVKVAQDTTTVIGPGGTPGASSTATITFDATNDVNTAFEPGGGSPASALDGIEITNTPVTFVVKADTTSALTGISTGAKVAMTAQITGDPGYTSGNTNQEDDWNDGNVFYSYHMNNSSTYIGGTSATTGFTASDSYQVDPQTLSN